MLKMRVLTLFDDYNFEARKTANQKDFEASYMDVLIAFPDMVDNAFMRLNKELFAIIEPASRNKNLPAVAISGFLQGSMIRQFPDYCRDFISHGGVRFKMKKENYEWLYIKKLDENKKPSNIETDNSIKIMKQLSDSALDVEPNVFLGYVASDDYSVAESVYAVYIVDKKVEWFTDLVDFAQRNRISAETVQLTALAQTKLKDDVVTVKRSANDQ